MSMSTRAVGFRKADEQWEKMKAIYVACISADVDPPEEVKEFFDELDPELCPGGEVNIENSLTEYNCVHSCASGFEVDLDKLPKDVKYLRFYNSW